MDALSGKHPSVPDVLVLCYHAISPAWSAALSARPEAFRTQVRALARRGYAGATFAQAVLYPPARRTVAFTFDDAFASVAELAAPILAEHGFPATVFAVTDFAAQGRSLEWDGIEHWVGGPHDRELLSLDWEGLRALAGRGWEIGSHTCSHPRLTRLGDERLASELSTSRVTCEQAIGTCISLAYPYGDVDARVVAAARAAGYRAAAALPKRWPAAPLDPLEYPRAGIWQGEGLLRLAVKSSPMARRARSALGR